MNIDKESLQKIAHLARLEMPESAEKEMMDSLNSVLTWMEELNEINTDNVKPLTHMSLEINALREDIVIPNISREQGLKNAPKQDGEYFRVPKVMEG
jgi:aspartyl-tRNA(Asn)/glutamyl-tRNA(Gln) amidotransferase subunit C